MKRRVMVKQAQRKENRQARQEETLSRALSDLNHDSWCQMANICERIPNVLHREWMRILTNACWYGNKEWIERCLRSAKKEDSFSIDVVITGKITPETLKFILGLRNLDISIDLTNSLFAALERERVDLAEILIREPSVREDYDPNFLTRYARDRFGKEADKFLCSIPDLSR